MKSKTMWLIVAVIIIVVAVVVFLVGRKASAPVPAPGATQATTTTQSLGAQIYTNVAPEAAVPQSLPQTNPFGQ